MLQCKRPAAPRKPGIEDTLGVVKTSWIALMLYYNPKTITLKGQGIADWGKKSPHVSAHGLRVLERFIVILIPRMVVLRIRS